MVLGLSSIIHSYRNLIIIDDQFAHKTYKNTSKFNTFPFAYRKKSSTLLNIPTLIKSLTDKFRFRARCCAPAKVAVELVRRGSNWNGQEAAQQHAAHVAGPFIYLAVRRWYLRTSSSAALVFAVRRTEEAQNQGKGILARECEWEWLFPPDHTPHRTAVVDPSLGGFLVWRRFFPVSESILN